MSGKCKTEYARENDIPEATFRAWIKEENNSNYGMLELDDDGTGKIVKPIKPTIFANEIIRIELREGYDKEFLRKMVEVLINDR